MSHTRVARPDPTAELLAKMEAFRTDTPIQTCSGICGNLEVRRVHCAALSNSLLEERPSAETVFV
jgi:hypothetical protein